MKAFRWSSGGGFDARRLRWVLAVVFLGLLVPTAILVYRSYDQLKWEALHQHRTTAEELAARIDSGVLALIAEEDARAYAEYSFIMFAGDPGAGFLQRSPLSAFPAAADFPGLIGYFQVQANGTLSTPLLPPPEVDPASYGITPTEYADRVAVQDEVQRVLGANRLVQSMPAAAPKEVVKEAPPTRRDLATLERDDSDDGDDGDDGAFGLIEEIRITAGARQANESSGYGVALAPAEPDVLLAERQAFDALGEGRASAMQKKSGLGRVEDLNLDSQYESRLNASEAATLAAPQASAPALNRAKRREQTALPEPALSERALPERALPESIEAGGKVDSLDESLQAPLPAAVDERRLDVEEKGASLEAETVPERLDASDSPDSRPVASRPVLSDRIEIPGRASGLVVNTFESELDPVRFSALGDAHLVLYRKVWRDGDSIVQGALIDRMAFVEAVFRGPFQATSLSAMSDLIVALDGEVVRGIRGVQPGRGDYLAGPAEFTGALLYRTRLTEPLGAFELLFTVTRLPTGPGGVVVLWLAVVLGLVLVGGFVALYRLGIGQIALNRQQQDFVAAVSHELKTPLTSIRMYGEMLQAGWAEEEKKQEYYDFICAESDRLSRLITNVLQLAQLTRNDPQFDPKPKAVAELADLIESKIGSQVQRADFELSVAVDEPTRATRVMVDVDCFSQVMINLVDNALKFSRDAESRRIEVGARLLDGRVCFSVRDFGPGVADDQMKKIFKLFYRTESELTRETVGTGIGLALVHQLVLAMGGEVDVRNRQPGAEFRVTLAVAE